MAGHEIFIGKPINRIMRDKSGRFVKGSVSNRKAIKNNNQKWFKKGNKPHNTYPEGTIFTRKGKNGWKCLVIKHNGKLKRLARHVWEQANGEIPSGCIVRHIDGDFTNVALENLMCITKSNNARLNINPNKVIATKAAKKRRKEVLIKCGLEELI